MVFSAWAVGRRENVDHIRLGLQQLVQAGIAVRQSKSFGQIFSPSLVDVGHADDVHVGQSP